MQFGVLLCVLFLRLALHVPEFSQFRLSPSATVSTRGCGIVLRKRLWVVPKITCPAIGQKSFGQWKTCLRSMSSLQRACQEPLVLLFCKLFYAVTSPGQIRLCVAASLSWLSCPIVECSSILLFRNRNRQVQTLELSWNWEENLYTEQVHFSRHQYSRQRGGKHSNEEEQDGPSMAYL